MALADRNSDERHKITDNTKLARMSASFAEAKHLELEAFPMERGMLYQIQGMQDDIKEIHRYLRAEITSFLVSPILPTNHLVPSIFKVSPKFLSHLDNIY